MQDKNKRAILDQLLKDVVYMLCIYYDLAAGTKELSLEDKKYLLSKGYDWIFVSEEKGVS